MKKILIIFILGAIISLAYFIYKQRNKTTAELLYEARIKNEKRAENHVFNLYKTTDFSFLYPEWPVIDPKKIMAPDVTRLALQDGEGCNFALTVNQLTDDTSFGDFVNQALNRQKKALKLKIIKQKNSTDSAEIEAYFMINKIPVHSYNYTVITKKKRIYSIGFISTRDYFDVACRPFMAKTIGSVKKI